tara:strand:+ start:1000 stop:1887 length:888 start_codon:yes stop_codon:yes gene_type:complete
MKAFIFPGQGSQFTGMGHDLYHSSSIAKKMFETGNKLLGFDICKIMFEGQAEALKQTNVTQPAIFLHSVILARCIHNFNPNMVAGHSLGEFSALVSANAISFEDGLKLVMQRAEAMHTACKLKKSSMAAIIGLDSKIIERICEKENKIVVIANYNAPNQIVISGDTNAVESTCIKLADIGAKRTVLLPVGGAFHSPLMEPAKRKLKIAIDDIHFNKPICPIYQNVSAKPILEQKKLKENLIQQLTSSVQWYQTINNMINDGAKKFIEVGPGNVLVGLNRRINRDVSSEKAKLENN